MAHPAPRSRRLRAGPPLRSRRRAIAVLLAAGFGAAAVLGLRAPVRAYPLDGYERTGIPRLLYQRKVQEGELQGRKRPGAGELMPLSMVRLKLLDHRELELPPVDPAFTAQVRKLLGPEADRYGISLLDLSDLTAPRYAEWRGKQLQNPGSVGKLVVALALFQGLADAFPDVADRERVLRDTMIVADDFSVYDHHTVPFFDPVSGKYQRHPLQIGDMASLWTYLDWMTSPSSNSAAAMLQKQLILLAHFQAAYPPSAEEEKRFFEETPKAEISAIFERAIQDPVRRNGLDLKALRQGSFFTHRGKRLVPGTSSYATPRELTRYLLRMEQGRLVDEFSSLEIKRLMYVTERRIRYASSGALRPSAVYFKSGSLYSCMKEEGFVCKKYHGNKRNYMNSVAVVETPAGQDRLFYIVSVLSNVLRKNSARDHRDLARAVHARLLRDHPAKPLAPGEPDPKLTYGEGFIGYVSAGKQKALAVDTQEALQALGYEIEVDGVIGRGTRKALRSFQSAHGLEADGKPSQALLDRMRRVAQEKGLARPFEGTE